MARFLQQLLNIEEPMFSSGLRQLEKATGHSGVDTRLIADITHMAHDIMRQLNLDTANTTARELYAALDSSLQHGSGKSLLFETDFVMLSIDTDIISFNLIDVIENHHHQLPFENRIISHGQRSLRGELIKRYLDHGRTDEATAMHLAEQAGLVVAQDKEYVALDASHKQAIQAETSAPRMLSIGAIVTDAFIELREDQASVTKDEKGFPQLVIPFGTKLPYQDATVIDAVGNSANAAVAFARLGLGSALVADVGDDQTGHDMLSYLKSERVDTDLIKVHEGKKSHYHYVLRYQADRTILIKYEDYEYGFYQPAQPCDWIYLSTISDNSWDAHVQLMDYLEANPAVRFAFQPGAYHFEWGTEKLSRLYRRTEIIVLNREEAAIITGLAVTSITDLAKALYELGPKTVVVTDGPSGSYVYDGTKLVKMRNYPDPGPPVDRTGAGDAFASTFVAALALGETIETALAWAPINSMSVVQKVGAQAGLLRREELQQYLAQAPEDYHPTESNE